MPGRGKKIRSGIFGKEKYIKMRSAPIPFGTEAIMKKFIFICDWKNQFSSTDKKSITVKYEQSVNMI